MNLRTDLALEKREIIAEEEPDGIICERTEASGAAVTRIEVINEAGEKKLGKPVGKYITVEMSAFSEDSRIFDGRLKTLTDELSRLLPKEGTILVIGLGNRDITPDALGPRCCELILATRHISGEVARSAGLGKLRPVASVVPGVLGKTGIETAETVRGIAETVKPSAVITVDALAARKVSRLGCTVQLADTGIVPGSGVGNSRCGLNRELLGVPVISIGVPTVVDAATLVCDMIEDTGHTVEESLRRRIEKEGAAVMVTPKEIDLTVERASRLVAMAINCALQPDITPEDLLALVS
ncbi:MAG: GPR endopeptidase [Saccharofermentans sp.]|nr:GPR endopeptidase [Saccharofermentans sp.]